MSRRRFFFLGAAAGVLAAINPTVQLADGLLVPEPFERVVIPVSQLYARIQLTAVEILASRDARSGAFWSAAIAAQAEAVRKLADSEARALMEGGRRRLS